MRSSAAFIRPSRCSASLANQRGAALFLHNIALLLALREPAAALLLLLRAEDAPPSSSIVLQPRRRAPIGAAGVRRPRAASSPRRRWPSARRPRRPRAPLLRRGRSVSVPALLHRAAPRVPPPRIGRRLGRRRALGRAERLVLRLQPPRAASASRSAGWSSPPAGASGWAAGLARALDQPRSRFLAAANARSASPARRSADPSPPEALEPRLERRRLRAALVGRPRGGLAPFGLAIGRRLRLRDGQPARPLWSGGRGLLRGRPLLRRRTGLGRRCGGALGRCQRRRPRPSCARRNSCLSCSSASRSFRSAASLARSCRCSTAILRCEGGPPARPRCGPRLPRAAASRAPRGRPHPRRLLRQCPAALLRPLPRAIGRQPRLQLITRARPPAHWPAPPAAPRAPRPRLSARGGAASMRAPLSSRMTRPARSLRLADAPLRARLRLRDPRAARAPMVRFFSAINFCSDDTVACGALQRPRGGGGGVGVGVGGGWGGAPRRSARAAGCARGTVARRRRPEGAVRPSQRSAALPARAPRPIGAAPDLAAERRVRRWPRRAREGEQLLPEV